MRHFLYLNNSIVDDYYEEIAGYSPNELSISSTSTSELKGKAGAMIPPLSLGASGNKESKTETNTTGSLTYPSKFKVIFDYIALNENNGENPYYDYIDEETLSNIFRNQYLEIDGTARLSKLAQLGHTAAVFKELATLGQKLTASQLISKEDEKGLLEFSDFSESVQNGKTSLVVSFPNTKITVVTELDNDFLLVNPNKLTTDVTLFCKVRKILNKGDSIKLDDFFDEAKESLNREQRRQMKDLKNPKEIDDVIHGPALLVETIAIYT